MYEVIKSTADLAGIFERMVTTPVNVEGTFRHVLGLVDAGGQLPWHRVGQPPNAEEMMRRGRRLQHALAALILGCCVMCTHANVQNAPTVQVPHACGVRMLLSTCRRMC